MTKFFSNNFFLLKKIIPQYIRNDHKKILTCQKNYQKKLPKNFVSIHTYQSEKNFSQFFLVNFLTC